MAEDDNRLSQVTNLLNVYRINKSLLETNEESKNKIYYGVSKKISYLGKVSYCNEDTSIEDANKIVDDFEKEYLRVISNFDYDTLNTLRMANYMEKNGGKLYVQENRTDFYINKISFFEKHIGIIEVDDLDIFKKKVSEYKELDDKRFLTKKLKNEKFSLENDIVLKAESFFKKIIEKYKEDYDDYCYSNENYHSKYDLINFLNSDRHDGPESEKEDSYQNITKNINRKKQEIEEVRNSIKQQKLDNAESLNNAKLKVSDNRNSFSSILGDMNFDASLDDLLDYVKKSGNDYYYWANRIKEDAADAKIRKEKNVILDDIVRDAQDEANMREASIKNVTLEELLEQKRRALEEKKAEIEQGIPEPGVPESPHPSDITWDPRTL